MFSWPSDGDLVVIAAFILGLAALVGGILGFALGAWLF